MSLTPEQELRRAAALDRADQIALEIQRKHRPRTEMAARLQAKGHTQEDFDEADRWMREYELGIRHLRRAMKALPDLISEAGCEAQVRELRRHVNRLSAVWREAKLSWHEHRPRIK